MKAESIMITSPSFYKERSACTLFHPELHSRKANTQLLTHTALCFIPPFHSFNFLQGDFFTTELTSHLHKPLLDIHLHGSLCTNHGSYRKTRPQDHR